MLREQMFHFVEMHGVLGAEHHLPVGLAHLLGFQDELRTDGSLKRLTLDLDHWRGLDPHPTTVTDDMHVATQDLDLPVLQFTRTCHGFSFDQSETLSRYWCIALK